MKKSRNKINWKRALLIHINIVVRKRSPKKFKLKDLYAFDDVYRKWFPTNNNRQAKIRQVLQQLRDEGIVEFLGDGQYRRIKKGL